jgi:hypothetical protein
MVPSRKFEGLIALPTDGRHLLGITIYIRNLLQKGILDARGFQEGADLLQKGEIGFQMYARFRMGFIGWPNLPM